MTLTFSDFNFKRVASVSLKRTSCAVSSSWRRDIMSGSRSTAENIEGKRERNELVLFKKSVFRYKEKVVKLFHFCKSYQNFLQRQ